MKPRATRISALLLCLLLTSATAYLWFTHERISGHVPDDWPLPYPYPDQPLDDLAAWFDSGTPPGFVNLNGGWTEVRLTVIGVILALTLVTGGAFTWLAIVRYRTDDEMNLQPKTIRGLFSLYAVGGFFVIALLAQQRFWAHQRTDQALLLASVWWTLFWPIVGIVLFTIKLRRRRA